MKKIVINDYHLLDENIDMKVVRVKALIVNSYRKILLAFNNNTYQFPGGHLEDDESIDDCIIREIKEETGISLKVEEKPFLCISTYDNDYFGTGKKVLNCIYYYHFLTDEFPNFEETHYDELELKTDFELFYVSVDGLGEFLKKGIHDGKVDPKIGKEMMYVLDVYNDIYKN